MDCGPGSPGGTAVTRVDVDSSTHPGKALKDTQTHSLRRIRMFSWGAPAGGGMQSPTWVALGYRLGIQSSWSRERRSKSISAAAALASTMIEWLSPGTVNPSSRNALATRRSGLSASAPHRIRR